MTTYARPNSPAKSWDDEAVEYWAAVAPLTDLPRTVLTALQPPLYTYLLHFWLIFGMPSIWLRLLSIALSLLSLLGVMVWTHRTLGSLRGALIAGSIMALLPVHVRYAQEIGEYALMLCMLTWSLVFLDDATATATAAATATQRWKSWILWGLFCVASIYSHYGTAFVILPLALLAFGRSLWRRQTQALHCEAAVGVAGLLAGLPLLVYFLPTQIKTAGQAAFAPPFSSWGAEIAGFLRAIAATLLYLLTFVPDLVLPGVAGQLLALAITVILLLVLWRRGNGVPRQAIGWFIVAYLVYFAVVRGGVYGYGIYGERYALILIPLFVVAVTAAIEQLFRWRLAPLALLLLLLVLAAECASLPQFHQSQLAGSFDTGEDMRPVFDYWRQNRTNDDPTYIYYGAAPAFRYYHRLAGAETDPLPATWYTACWRGEDLPACAMDGIFYGAWIRDLPPQDKVTSMLHSLPVTHQRFWTIFSHVVGQEDNAILQQLFRHYVVIDTYRQGLSSAYLLQSY